MLPAEAPVVLVVENHQDDYQSLVAAIEQCSLSAVIYWVKTGSEALDFLLRQGAYAQANAAPRPDLIFLELDATTNDGLEVIQCLRQTPDLKNIPVLVWTRINRMTAIDTCYYVGVNSYVIKSAQPEAWPEQLQVLLKYWFAVSLLPDRLIRS